MTDLPLDDDGYLRMAAFSDDDLDAEPDPLDAPDPLPDSAWSRLLAAAVAEPPVPDDTDPADPAAGDPDDDTPVATDDWTVDASSLDTPDGATVLDPLGEPPPDDL
ncbi:MAG TPA: hypothetical protein VM367_09975 [Pseudonocardia sp.]|nr:hypothetical protein [Pseudonocardia sp.]